MDSKPKAEVQPAAIVGWATKVAPHRPPTTAVPAAASQAPSVLSLLLPAADPVDQALTSATLLAAALASKVAALRD